MTAKDVRALQAGKPLWWRMLKRQDVLAGLLFMAIAALGLWVSRNYSIGTALRMSTGYVPRLLCWILLLIGAGLGFAGIRERDASLHASEASGETDSATRPLIFVIGSLVAFGLSIERLGLVVATLLLVGIGSFATRGLRLFETVIAGIVLASIAVGIFILGLGITIPVWPDW